MALIDIINAIRNIINQFNELRNSNDYCLNKLYYNITKKNKKLRDIETRGH